MSECISKEAPADLRARAERYRWLAREFPPDMRPAVLEFVAELKAMAANLEADQS